MYLLKWSGDTDLCDILPLNPLHLSNNEKTSKKSKLRDILLISFLKSFKILKGNTDQLSHIREDKGDPVTKCNMVSWIRSWKRKKDISGKPDGIWKSLSIASSIALMLTS